MLGLGWCRTVAHGLYAWVKIQDVLVEELMFLTSLKLGRSRLVNSHLNHSAPKS